MKPLVWIMSALLILLIVVPVVLMAWAVSPWFLIGLVLLIVVPFFFINRQNA